MGKKTLILTEDQIKGVIDNLLTEQVYTDFDKTYDYKLTGNMWYGSRKGQNKWFSLKKSPQAIKNLNSRYGKNVSTGAAPPKPAPVKQPQAKVEPEAKPEEDDGWNFGDKLSSWKDAIADKFSSAGEGIGRFMRKLAPNVAQMFFTRPLTGEDFTHKQKGVINNVIQNAVQRTKRKNRGVTNYRDYGEYIEKSFDNRVGANTKDIITKSVTDPYFQVASTLGAFTYQLQPDGTYKVSDIYDFSKGIGYTVKKEEIEGMPYLKQLQYVMKKDDLTPYRAARQIAYLEHPDTASPDEKVRIELTVDPKDYSDEQPSVT